MNKILCILIVMFMIQGCGSGGVDIAPQVTPMSEVDSISRGVVSTNGRALCLGLDDFKVISGKLYREEKDCYNIASLCVKNNFPTIYLKSSECTRVRFEQEVDKAVKYLNSGDTFFLYIGSHGMVNGNGSMVVLYDSFYYGSEFMKLWTRFKPGVHIVFICNTCHSETIAFKSLQERLCVERQLSMDNVSRVDLNVTVVSVTACKVSEVTYEGLFPNAILTSYSNNKNNNYKQFTSDVSKLIEKTGRNVHPQYTVLGANDNNFLSGKIFTY